MPFIKAVHLDRSENRFEFDPSGKKRGPLSKASSPAHETEPSELFKSSEFCASCHEYTNAHGITILWTFSEWKDSPYAGEGVECEDCHKPLIEGNVADPKIKVSSQKMINRHAISAAHSTAQLEKAVRLEIKKVDKDSKHHLLVGSFHTHEGERLAACLEQFAAGVAAGPEAAP